MDNLYLDISDVEEQSQINANILSTNKQMDKDDKTKISSFCARRT